VIGILPLALTVAAQLDRLIPLALQNRVFLILIVAIGALFVVTVVLGVIAVVLRAKNVQKAARWQRLEARWEPEFLEVLAGRRQPEAVRALVAPGDELYFVDLVLRYARRVRGTERDLLARMAEPFLPPVVERVHGADAERRARAVQTLGELGLPRYDREVITALDDPSPLVAMIAARALARRESPQYAADVLARLHRFTSWRPSFLASMLSSMGPDVAAGLRETLADPSLVSTVRSIAAIALRQLNDLPSAAVAVQVLAEGGGDRDLLAACLRLLGTVGSTEHLSTVRRMTTSDDFVVRATAFGALGTLGEPADLARLREAAYQDVSHWVAISAARALKDSGGADVLRDLASAGHVRSSVAMQVLWEVPE